MYQVNLFFLYELYVKEKKQEGQLKKMFYLTLNKMRDLEKLKFQLEGEQLFFILQNQKNY